MVEPRCEFCSNSSARLALGALGRRLPDTGCESFSPGVSVVTEASSHALIPTSAPQLWSPESDLGPDVYSPTSLAFPLQRAPNGRAK